MGDSKIVLEAAEKEFDRLCDLWDIDNDVACMSEEDKDSFNSQKGPIVKAFHDGRVLLDEAGLLTVKLKSSERFDGDELVLDCEKGDLLDFDKHKGKMRGLYEYATSMAGLTTAEFAKVSTKDKKFITKVVTLFLAS